MAAFHFSAWFLAIISTVNGANILGLFTGLSPSHLIIQLSMARILAERGHNMTVVTVLEPPFRYKDINYVLVPLGKEELQGFSALIGDIAKKDNRNVVGFLSGIFSASTQLSSKLSSVVKHPLYKDLYENQSNKFDLVILGYFINSFQMALAHKLKVPQVLAISNPPSYISHKLGNPAEVSYVPCTYMVDVHGIRNRFLNLFYFLAEKIFWYSLEYYNEIIYRQTYGDDPDLPRYGDLDKNISLIFFASHGVSERAIRPNLPTVIEIGGIQIKETPDPLPQNLESFLKNATDGAILLSLGTNIKRSHLNQETVRSMFNVLSQLNQKVIWKWDDLDNLPGESDNILYAHWLPQGDILAHPKIKLFITHAGKGGITEAQYHGKPMLALPVFFDQPQNAKAMEQQGFGITQSLLTLDEHSFAEGIREVLGNPKYAQAVKSFSSIYRDRPLSVQDTLIYWVDYVIRHRGAKHLQSPVVHMSLIAVHNLDVYAIILGAIFVIWIKFKTVVSGIIRKVRSRSMKPIKSKKPKIKTN
ncbi:hypothetical protein KR074_005189 [Drosophila pseudoananassae]|nr:hypothetical protein KR074_005189 [Drosophila pseudoananassae]